MSDGQPEAGASSMAEAFQSICLMEGPLRDRLAAYAAKLHELASPTAAAYDELVERLSAANVGSSAPKVGEELPPFLLPSKGGKLVSLADLLAGGPAVISFNRGHWCSFCRLELRTIAEFHDAIASRGAEAVSIVPDRQQFLDGLRQETGHRLRILSDIDNAYALSLGLVVWLGQRVSELMESRGTKLDVIQGSGGWFVPLPATFVVGRDGVIAASLVDPDFRRRMDMEDVLAALDVLQANGGRGRS